jgi:proline iminopeptidase
MSPASQVPADSRAVTDEPPPSRRHHALLRALIIFFAAILVSLLAAVTMIGLAALTKSLGWSVVFGILVAVIASWILGFLIWRRDREVGGSAGRRLVIGPLLVLGCAALLSLSWLYPGTGSVRPDLIAGVEHLDLPDGSRLALHVTHAAGATQPPIIFVHGGPGVADMAHDAAALAPLATDRDVYVYDRIGTGASSRLADPTGYTTARAVDDLEAVRARTGAPRVVLMGHSWGTWFAVAYAQEHRDHVAALVLTAPGDLPLERADVPPGDLTTRLDTSELAREYLRLLRPRNLFAYALTTVDPRVAHSMAGDREMDRRFSAIYRISTPALFCDKRLADQVGTTGVGYYAHYVPQLHPDPADLPLYRDQLAMIKVPVLVIKPACDYVAWFAVVGYQRAFPQAQLVMIPDAGHVAYVEQPALYAALVQAFLAGEKLPLPTIEGTTVPDGYRGTR